MAQLSYNLDQQVALLGMLADSRFKNTDSKTASEAIPAGRAVTIVPATDRVQVKLPDATDNAIYGIAHFTQFQEGEMIYPVNSSVNILTQGAVYVWCETAFNPDTDTLYVRTVAGGAGEEKGQFRNEATNAVAVTGNFSVDSSLSVAGLLKLVINKPE